MQTTRRVSTFDERKAQRTQDARALMETLAARATGRKLHDVLQRGIAIVERGYPPINRHIGQDADGVFIYAPIRYAPYGHTFSTPDGPYTATSARFFLQESLITSVNIIGLMVLGLLDEDELKPEFDQKLLDLQVYSIISFHDYLQHIFPALAQPATPIATTYSKLVEYETLMDYLCTMTERIATWQWTGQWTQYGALQFLRDLDI